MKKNNLDDLYREKLKDFQELPDATVWARIAASLDKKKKKRVIPIWWQLGGVAALLAVLFYVFSPSADENIVPDQPVVGTQERTTKTQGKDSEKDSNLTPVPSGQQETPQVVENDISTKEKTIAKPDETNLSWNRRNGVTQKGVPSDGIVVAANEKKATHPKDPQSLVEREPQNQNSREQQEIRLAAENTEKEPATKAKEGSDVILPEKQKEEAVARQEVEEATTSIFEAIEQQKGLEENALAENKPNNRWSMGPSIAPVYFNSLGEGSPIHSNFAPNSKSGKVNLSYGLMVSYNVSKKLSIRSGVHMVDFGYDTNDVVFSSSLATPGNARIDNIDYAQNSRNLVVESKATRQPPSFNNNTFAGEISPLEGRMVQQLGYLEVPMELNYALVDKKFGVNIIGGISSLFLVDNAVSLESEGLVTEMGEANNVNNVNFSTNIGVGLNYEIAPKIQLNLEPMFKYQLNTFSEIEGGSFRPYSVGVYSGLSFRF